MAPKSRAAAKLAPKGGVAKPAKKEAKAPAKAKAAAASKGQGADVEIEACKS